MYPGTIRTPTLSIWADMPGNTTGKEGEEQGMYFGKTVISRSNWCMCRSGLILSRHYVHTKCSPSRAALLTGRYAWTLGRQRGAIERYQPAGLSTSFSLLPSYLQKAGYVTHAVGKESQAKLDNIFSIFSLTQ